MSNALTASKRWIVFAAMGIGVAMLSGCHPHQVKPAHYPHSASYPAYKPPYPYYPAQPHRPSHTGNYSPRYSSSYPQKTPHHPGQPNHPSYKTTKQSPGKHNDRHSHKKPNQHNDRYGTKQQKPEKPQKWDQTSNQRGKNGYQKPTVLRSDSKPDARSSFKPSPRSVPKSDPMPVSHKPKVQHSHKKHYKLNRPLPKNVRFDYLPRDIERRYKPAPKGFIHIRIGSDILLMNQQTRVILKAVL